MELLFRGLLLFVICAENVGARIYFSILFFPIFSILPVYLCAKVLLATVLYYLLYSLFRICMAYLVGSGMGHE